MGELASHGLRMLLLLLLPTGHGTCPLHLEGAIPLVDPHQGTGRSRWVRVAMKVKILTVLAPLFHAGGAGAGKKHEGRSTSTVGHIRVTIE
jgi:hypothetical protein